jgi:SAM-dependent methyltransferase
MNAIARCITSLTIIVLLMSAPCYAFVGKYSVSTLAPLQKKEAKVVEDFRGVQEFYSKRAPDYGERLDFGFDDDAKSYDDIIEKIISYVESDLQKNHHEDAVILDAGAGTGLYTKELCVLERVKQVVALDITKAMLAKLDEEIANAPDSSKQMLNKITTVQGSVTKIDEALEGIPHQQFHAIVCGYMSHHLKTSGHKDERDGLDPILLKALQQFYSVLVPGGKAYMTCTYSEHRDMGRYARAAGFDVGEGQKTLRYYGADYDEADTYIILHKPATVDQAFLNAA